MAPFGRLFAEGGGRRLLDFGCGNGLFLDLAHERGFACHGVDLAADAIEVARTRPGGDAHLPRPAGRDPRARRRRLRRDHDVVGAGPRRRAGRRHRDAAAPAGARRRAPGADGQRRLAQAQAPARALGWLHGQPPRVLLAADAAAAAARARDSPRWSRRRGTASRSSWGRRRSPRGSSGGRGARSTAATAATCCARRRSPRPTGRAAGGSRGRLWREHGTGSFQRSISPLREGEAEESEVPGMSHPADRIRNVALVGHRGSGKTSLHEALLFEAGATTRLGSVADGTTVSDCRRRREVARDVDLRVAGLVRLARHEGQPDRHPRRAVLHRRRPRRAARVRVGRVRRQRGDGRRGRHAAPVGARQGARRGAAGLREHARPRAGRLLPRARLAEGRLRAARGRDGDPDRLRARHPRADRPRRHEGVRLRRLRQGQLQGDPDPRRSRRARAGVPREAHGRGRRELRVADGALPRGRGDLPRGDRVRARGRHRPRPHLPRDLRRGDRAPRRRPAAGGDRRRPARRPSSTAGSSSRT